MEKTLDGKYGTDTSNVGVRSLIIIFNVIYLVIRLKKFYFGQIGRSWVWLEFNKSLV